MQNLSGTDFYILTPQQADALDSEILSNMDDPATPVPSGCGTMVQVTNDQDLTYLENALP
jgi:hypothetical protein